MFMRISDEKILINYCRFGKDEITVNKKFKITKNYIIDLVKGHTYTDVQLHKDWYKLPGDFDKINKLLEEM